MGLIDERVGSRSLEGRGAAFAEHDCRSVLGMGRDDAGLTAGQEVLVEGWAEAVATPSARTSAEAPRRANLRMIISIQRI